MALQAIGAIDACRDNLDQNLAGTRFGHWRLAYSYDVRPAMAPEIRLPHPPHEVARVV